MMSQEFDEAPEDETFLARLDRWVRESPDSPCYHVVRDLAGNKDSFSYLEVERLCRSAAAAYRAAGLRPGDRVLLDLQTDEFFAAAILGAFHLGLTPASVAPLEQRRGPAALQDWQHHLDSLAPAAIVSRHAASSEGLLVLHPEDLAKGNPDDAGPRAPADQVAYVQYSSGSTGAPKALVLGLPGICANLQGMHKLIPMQRGEHITSWLPMYHDMGLFGTLLLVLHSGAQLTMMDPSLFARSPLLWFSVMESAGTNICVAPPSAMKAAFELLRRRPPESLDLSSCTRWICGSEQVTPELIALFHEVICPYGPPAAALKPVYGMAEITLAATMAPLDRGQLIVEVDRAAFEAETRAIAPRSEASLGWTGVGHMMTGQGMRIVDDAGAVLPDNRVGRIELDSPSLYLGTLDAGVFTPRPAGWHDTGDLGFKRGLELFITGRRRELIIKNGRNYAPERIEEMAGVVEHTGRAAAFGVFDPRRQTERAILAVECHPRAMGKPEQRDAMRLAVRHALADAGYDIDEVLLVERGALPRTTSGKIRRSAARDQYLAGASFVRPASAPKS
jgi:fatty-acyl-CoA synthase